MSGCITRGTTLNFDSDLQIAFDTGLSMQFSLDIAFLIIFLIEDPSLKLNHTAM